MSVIVMLVFVCCRDYPLLFETFNMPKKKTSSKLKVSTCDLDRGSSPRVAAALKALKSEDWSQSSLAEAAGINRGVLNQLWQGKTSSSAMLVGRLCAVLARDDAVRILAAYLDDVAADVAAEEQAVETGAKRTALKAELLVRYPPKSEDGAS